MNRRVGCNGFVKELSGGMGSHRCFDAPPKSGNSWIDADDDP